MNTTTWIHQFDFQTTSIWLHQFDYDLMTTESRRQQIHNQRHIHTHIHIRLHLHNHIFTMNLWNPITFFQPNFDINQSTKTTLPKRWPHIQNMIQTNAKIPTLNQSPTDFKHTAILIYIWGEIFLECNECIYGGGFRLAIMRVYICGKIFALHNTHIKHGENPKIIMQKNCLESIKIFRQKNVYVWAILKASCNTSHSTLKLFHFNDLPN